MLEYKNIDINDLILNNKNPRINDEAAKKLMIGIEKYGFINPIIVNNKSNVVLAGHTRIKALELLGKKTVPVIFVDMDETTAKGFSIWDNKSAEFSEWDMDLLSLEIKDLNMEDFDLELTGFDLDELQDFINDEDPGTEGLTDDDQVPEVVEPVCKLGDLWILGQHRLLCGDSTNIEDVERLMDGQKADMVFTDPPYGYKYESNYQQTHKMLLNDDKILNFLPLCSKYMEENSAIYLCTSHQVVDIWKPLVEEYFKYKNLIVWMKNNWSMGDLEGAYAGQHEIILFAHKGRVTIEGKRDTDIWEFKRTKPSLHPTQKTVELIEYAITKIMCNRVLDLFLGSGSTLIACEKTNRKCFGMELSQEYCTVILQRFLEFTGKDPVREDGKTFSELKK